MFTGPDIVTDGLVLALDAGNTKSYPGSGTTWYDKVGGYNASITNGPTFSTNNNGHLTFDGTNDYATSATVSYPSTWTDPFSLEVWFKVDTGLTWYNQGSGTCIVGRGSYGGSIGLFRGSTDNQVAFWVRTGSNIFDPRGTVVRDKFQHLVGVWDGVDTARLYINGVFTSNETSTNISGTPDSGGYRVMGNIAFGGNNGLYGAGDLAIMKVYSKALSASEVLQNYNAAKSRFGL